MEGEHMELPQPRLKGDLSLEETLSRRRSTREYASEPVTVEELSQVLWAGQGITGDSGFRAAPSGGATYPLETYVLAGDVVDLAPGLYRYDSSSHSLTLVKDGDLRAEMAEAALGQPCVRGAAAIIVLSAIYERTTERYGDRGKMYVHMDVGHAAENMLLQATSLGLGSVPVGAFRTRTVATLLGLADTEFPMYLLPIGRI
jgi:SagB-type dehydrogenase family enzyme